MPELRFAGAAEIFVIVVLVAAQGCTVLTGSSRDASNDISDVAFDEVSVPCPPAPADDAQVRAHAIPIPRTESFHFRSSFLDHSHRSYGVGGTVPPQRNSGQAAVVRVLSSGELDLSFGTGGYVLFGEDAVGVSKAFYAMTEDAQQRLVLAGTGVVTVNGIWQPPLAYVTRLDSTGTLDPTFGSSGAVEFNETTAIYDLAMDGSRIVAVGSDVDQFGVGTLGFIAAFRDDGSLDSGFNGGQIWFDYSAESYDAVSIRGTGYLVAGAARGQGGARVVRFNRDGTLDMSFGSGGIATHPVVPTMRVRAIAVNDDESVVVGGADAARRPTLVRFTSRGQPDMTFGLGGAFATYSVLWDVGYSLHSTMARQCDGQLLLGIAPAIFRVDASGHDSVMFNGLTFPGHEEAVIGVTIDPSDGTAIALTGMDGVVTDTLGEWILTP